MTNITEKLAEALRRLYATYDKSSVMYCRAFEYDAEQALDAFDANPSGCDKPPMKEGDG